MGRNYLIELVRKVGDGCCFDEGIVGLGKQCGQLTSPLVSSPTGFQGQYICGECSGEMREHVGISLEVGPQDWP